MSLLEVADVTHRYGGTKARAALNNVSVVVSRGEVVAVVGESGCGKTTLGKLAAGFLRPTAGTVSFEDRDIWSLKGKDYKTWRRSVQMVHQDPYSSLNPGLTIAGTLRPALLLHKLAGRRGVQDEMLRTLALVGLDATPSFLRRYPHQLSGGQRQRVAIARAMSLRPRLIIADEVTSMLDVSLRVAILDLLLSFRKGDTVDGMITYLFISHDFGVVRYFSRGGRIIVMFYGVVVEEGPTEDVISYPCHPYTYLLLEAIPVPDPDVTEHRVGPESLMEQSEGEPSPTGCVFSNRCPFAEARCHGSQPSLTEVRAAHRTACFFPERVPTVSHLVEGVSQ
jgi:oligopeptide/dipeptide ABC transporter ATP-binding protein